MTKEFALIPLFEQFIKDSRSGRRTGPNGRRIKPQTILNYHYVLKLLMEFCQKTGFYLRVRPVTRLNTRQLHVEKHYWKRFYQRFTGFLYRGKGYFDNSTGSTIKILRTFFGYLNREMLITTGDFYKTFYVQSEAISIVTLLPHQLQFLIKDNSFTESLPDSLKQTKNTFVFGCTVALRFSDLFNIRFRDVEQVNGNFYLSVRSIKTNTHTRIKLPEYAVEIINACRKRNNHSAKVFKPISLGQFNKNLRALVRRAGWTDETGKFRSRNGLARELFKGINKRGFHFYDLVSSHIMRRTAITTMLILGMPENVVRKISGHAANSKAFYRYVNFVQSYLDEEIDKVHNKLLSA